MSYELTVVQKPKYLHVIVRGQNSVENVVGYLQKTLDECIARQCSRVLIEERLAGPRLEMLDVFDIASKGGVNVAGNLTAIAYVDVNAEGELMQFAETVALNRGVPVAVFPTVLAAEQWLQSEDP